MKNTNISDQYSRKIRHHSPRKTAPKSFSITPENSKKLDKLNIYISKIVRDFIDGHSREYLLENYATEKFILKNNPKRITTSVGILKEQLDKIEGINLTVLVNELIENL